MWQSGIKRQIRVEVRRARVRPERQRLEEEEEEGSTCSQYLSMSVLSGTSLKSVEDIAIPPAFRHFIIF